MRRSGTGSRWSWCSRAAGVTATAIMVAANALAGAPSAYAIDPPAIDPAARPPDGTPGPEQTMRQNAYCTGVGVLPGTDFRVQPGYMDMLNLPEAWRFGRGAGVKIAVIDTGVTPHPRLPNLIPGGDYVVAAGDGLSDCDAHGTIVASMIGASPGSAPLAPAPPRRPIPVPTVEPPPPPPQAPPPQTITLEIPPPAAPPAPSAETPPGEAPGPPPPPWEAPPPGPAPAPPPPGAPPPPEAPSPPGPAPAPPPGAPPPPGPAPAPGPRPGPVVPQEPAPAPVPVVPPEPFANRAEKDRGTAAAAGYSGGGQVVAVDYPHAGPVPQAPPPALSSDAFSGIAPDAQIISIRQSSQAFSPKDAFSDGQDPQTRAKIDFMQTMARAVVHAADLGASVINISQATCMSVRSMINQPTLGAAIRYAAVEKDAVIVAAAGDTTSRDCKQNPNYNPLQPGDPRDWGGVGTVATPAWFSDYVLTVGAVDSTGIPMEVSVAGPWVSIAAPGIDVVGLSPLDDNLINAVDGPDNTLLTPTGSGFSAAIVSGVAALVRARYPHLSARQIIDRLTHTARAPARGVDNQIGYGVVDPVAALTWDVATEAPGPQRLSAPLELPPQPPDRNMTPVWVAGGGLAGLVLAVCAVFGTTTMMRRTPRHR